jgi:hypothetical protein
MAEHKGMEYFDKGLDDSPKPVAAGTFEEWFAQQRGTWLDGKGRFENCWQAAQAASQQELDALRARLESLDKIWSERAQLAHDTDYQQCLNELRAAIRLTLNNYLSNTPPTGDGGQPGKESA